ncbi:hypothetical protein D9M68_994310 [compost metagenome]
MIRYSLRSYCSVNRLETLRHSRQVKMRSSFSSGRTGRCALKSLRGILAKRKLKSAINRGAKALAASMLLMPRSRSSLTSRSCSVPFIRSTRPLAWLELAHRLSILSSYSARPNCV